MALKGVGVEGTAGRAFDERRTVDKRCVLMDVRMQPVAQWQKVCFFEGGSDAGVGDGSLKNLGRGEGTEGIGREISEMTFVPVDILEHAFGVVGWGDAYKALHAFVPCGAKVADF